MSSSLNRIVLASFETGLVTTYKPWTLTNDAFMTLFNAYLWRKQLLKKQGTRLLGRLQRILTAQSLGPTDGGGAFSNNIFTVLGLNTTQPNASILPGSITVNIGAQVFIEVVPIDGTLTNGAGGTGTINYATGALAFTTNPALPAAPITITFTYYPNLVSLGIEEYEYEKNQDDPINMPDVVYFDQRYAYQYNQSSNPLVTPSTFYDVSFYKMAAPRNPVIWSGETYQQFYSCSYYNALWVTNNKPGFHAATITAMANQGPLLIIQMTLSVTNLVVGDLLWFNSLSGVTVIPNGTIGTVTNLVGAGVYDVTFTANQTINGYVVASGVVQLLTNSVAGQDGIRWYDGDSATEGFINFAPPLDGSATPIYLVGCRILLPFSNYLLAIGTYERNPSGTISYYANRVRYSQKGTPFYNSIVPDGSSVASNNIDAWYQSPNGFGGFLNIGAAEKIITAAPSQDSLIIGTENYKYKFNYTGNDLFPLGYQLLSPEYGDQATHATIPLDVGVISVGDYGFIMTTSYNSSQRFDDKILDQVFQINTDDRGSDRLCGIRDWINEWIYFTYPQQGVNARYPTRSLFFNYREKSFAVFKEQFTTYGYFRAQRDKTWEDFANLTWADANFTWQSTSTADRAAKVSAGNQQGFIQQKDTGTLNDYSHYIQSILSVPLSNSTQITSPSHCLEVGDYIYITGCIGNTQLNNQIAQVLSVGTETTGGFIDPSTFVIGIEASAGGYIGGGVYKVLDNFLIQTRMFPLGWEGGRACRIGSQQYLFNTTSNGELTSNIYTSMDSANPVNNQAINTYLTTSQVVRTRPDDSLGMNNTQASKPQLWHRKFGSYVGSTVQLGLTLSDEQMRDLNIVSSAVGVQAIVIEFYTGSRVLA